MRRQILRTQDEFTKRSFEQPETVKEELLGGVRAFLGPDYDIATHFTPRYRPWRQRIAFVPDGDLFQGIAAGKATMAYQLYDASNNLLSSYSAPNQVTVLSGSSATGGPLTGSVGSDGWNHFFTTANSDFDNAPDSATTGAARATSTRWMVSITPVPRPVERP